jgi:hypothetical protein
MARGAPDVLDPGVKTETVVVEVSLASPTGEVILVDGHLNVEELPSALVAAAAGKPWVGTLFAFGAGAHYLRVRNPDYTLVLKTRRARENS